MLQELEEPQEKPKEKPQEELFKDEIIEKGPPARKYSFGKPKQEKRLPESPFKTYDKNGNPCKLCFQTEGIFIQYDEKEYESNKPDDEKIFYREIGLVKSVPTKNFGSLYNNLFLKTKFGIRIFYFIPSEYEIIIRKVIHGI